MPTPAEQLLKIKCTLSISITGMAKLLSLESAKELFEISEGCEPHTSESRDRLEWLWQATELWNQQYRPGVFRPRMEFLEKPLSNGQTTFSILQQQHSLDALSAMFSELREIGQQYEEWIEQRRQRLAPSSLTPEQERTNRLLMSKVVSFEL